MSSRAEEFKKAVKDVKAQIDKKKPIQLTPDQTAVIAYLVKEGAKAKGRWVSAFPKSFPTRAFNHLRDIGMIEEKSVPISWREIKKRKRTNYAHQPKRLFFRFNATFLRPVKGVAPRVSREIHRGFLQGRSWTPWRPFHNIHEQLGAMKCGVRPRRRKCLKYSTHVSYTCDLLQGIHGRLANCANCIPKDDPQA